MNANLVNKSPAERIRKLDAHLDGALKLTMKIFQTNMPTFVRKVSAGEK